MATSISAGKSRNLPSLAPVLDFVSRNSFKIMCSAGVTAFVATLLSLEVVASIAAVVCLIFIGKEEQA